MAIGAPPHRRSGRSFAFERWPCFDGHAWARVVEETDQRAHAARARLRSGDTPPILAADRDAGAVATARENAARAGVSELINFRHASVSDAMPPPPAQPVHQPRAHAVVHGTGDAGQEADEADEADEASELSEVSEAMAPSALRDGLVLTNPPWGLRSSGDSGDKRKLYYKLGQTFRANFGPGWRLALLVNPESRELARLAGVRAGPMLELTMGRERVSLVSNTKAATSQSPSQSESRSPSSSAAAGEGVQPRRNRGELRAHVGAAAGDETEQPALSRRQLRRMTYRRGKTALPKAARAALPTEAS